MITILLIFVGLLFVTGLTVHAYNKYVMKRYNIIELEDFSHFTCDSCGEKKISVDKFDGKCHNCGSESFTFYF